MSRPRDPASRAPGPSREGGHLSRRAIKRRRRRCQLTSRWHCRCWIRRWTAPVGAVWPCWPLCGLSAFGWEVELPWRHLGRFSDRIKYPPIFADLAGVCVRRREVNVGGEVEASWPRVNKPTRLPRHRHSPEAATLDLCLGMMRLRYSSINSRHVLIVGVRSIYSCAAAKCIILLFFFCRTWRSCDILMGFVQFHSGRCYTSTPQATSTYT